MEPPVVYDSDGTPVTPELVQRAYWARCFPMAEHRDGRISWYRPEVRAVITWARWRVPRSLAKRLRQGRYRLTRDRAFAAVVHACAQRSDTWISNDVERLYVALHRCGTAHSVEAWDGDELVGGLYGLCLGAVFCGESMFHRVADASKMCVVHLVDHLQDQGFVLLDCQQQSEHMRRFGAFEIADARYAEVLASCHEHCRFLPSESDD